jgi:AraC-like DNA-binding protein/quercetin dioxygenase-like cupin family protein
MPEIIDVPSFLPPGRQVAVRALNAAETDGWRPHTHPTGQLYYLFKGMLVIEDKLGLLLIPPGQVGWIPAGIVHRAHEHGAIAGWAAYVTPEFRNVLPAEPCIVRCSEFVPLIMKRFLDWQELELGELRGELNPERPPDPRHDRLVQVFFDELREARAIPERLPFPEDARLTGLARALMENPGDTRSLAEWAVQIGMSERSLSRRFSEETGITFAEWRRLCRLWKARERLRQGDSVQECAWSLGYENVSAFINAFKSAFGQTPAQYRVSIS